MSQRIMLTEDVTDDSLYLQVAERPLEGVCKHRPNVHSLYTGSSAPHLKGGEKS